MDVLVDHFEYEINTSSRSVSSEIIEWLRSYAEDRWSVQLKNIDQDLNFYWPCSLLVVVIKDEPLDLLFALRWGNLCSSREVWQRPRL